MELYLGKDAQPGSEILGQQYDIYTEKAESVDILKGFTNDKRSSGSKQADDVNVYSLLECVEPPYNMRYLAKLYEVSSIHAAAVDAKVDNIVGFGWKLNYSSKAEQNRLDADKDSSDTGDQRRDFLERKLEREKLKIQDYIDSLNNIDEFDEVLTKCMKDLFTLGNGYLEVGRDAEGNIAYLGHIPGVDIRIRKKRDGFVQYTNSDVVFFRNFGDTKTKNPLKNDPHPNELIHLTTYSPSNNFYGVPDIVSAVEAVAGIEFASKYNIEYFENKAIPKYVIKLKNLSLGDSELQKLTKFFSSSTNNNAHRTVVVPLDGAEDSDILFEAIESGKQDGAFKDYTELNIKMILSRHRVPKNRLGITDAQGLSTSRDADKIFKESVCRPMQRLLEKKIQKIIKTVTTLFEFKLVEYSLTDEETQAKIDEIDMRMGSMLPDERRAKIGMQRRPDGKGDHGVGLGDLAEMGKKDAQANYSTSRTLNDNKTDATNARRRDQQRQTNRPDGTNTNNSRNPKGGGRQQE